jgi:cell division septation protein DedD
MAASSQAKPSAAPQKTPDVQSIVNDLPVVAASGVGAAAQTPGSTTAGGADTTHTTQPLIQFAQPATALEEAPAGMLMIQIAAISHQEDADVLVGALRQRGYSATVSRDAADSQFHVRVGPFTSRTLANEMRQKLNGDGYNAVVQP